MYCRVFSPIPDLYSLNGSIFSTLPPPAVTIKKGFHTFPNTPEKQTPLIAENQRSRMQIAREGVLKDEAEVTAKL